ncbi:LETM1 domain-containing protein 1 [Paramormyrops kingsleyae]|uniref:LETM1 domain containing 1 n=1 Tax=Paramormyrops kingsleyae TaxID=1676925 RepID=A0A3B3RT24_9TELE|nr:LETM1 domain-containing protein 1 isoform X1 [Paramormyrops kingsleyae]
MSLSLAGVCRGSALVLLHGIRPAGVKNGICTPVLVFSRLSLTLCNHYSSSKARLGLSRHVASRLRWANEKYEKFLQRRFPRFYVLYHTFMTGFRLLFQNAKEVRIIKTKMISNNVKFQNLSYREMETLRQFRRDMIKAIPLVLISVPPFANYLVFVLMYFFPRQLLIRHFWTPRQQVEFQRIYHSRRAENHVAILTGLTKTVPAVGDSRLQSRLLDLCNKVQSGAQPSVPEIQAVKGLFSGPPLGMKRLDADHMRLLCPLFFLTPWLPAFAVSHRLRGQALELLQLDRALHRLGVHELSESELRQACYLRGVDSSRLSVAECQDWLIQWLKLSNQLKESETSLLLHSMVLLSANYPKPFYL